MKAIEHSVLWRFNSKAAISNSYGHRHGPITTAKARCSSTTLGACRPYKSMRQPNNRRINDDIKIVSVLNSVKGELRNHLLLKMDDTTPFDDVKESIADFFQSTYVIQQTRSGGQGYQGHQPMEIDQINGFKRKKGKQRKVGKEKESQKVLQSKARAMASQKVKESRVRSSSGLRVRINRKVTSRISISSLREKASIRPRVLLKEDPVHNAQAKAKASQESLAGHVADKRQETRSLMKSVLVERLSVPARRHRIRAASHAARVRHTNDGPTFTIESKRIAVARSSVRVRWSLMTVSLKYDLGAAVFAAAPSCAPHVPLQPIMGDHKPQSVTDAEIKIHGFKKCTIMSGGSCTCMRHQGEPCQRTRLVSHYPQDEVHLGEWIHEPCGFRLESQQSSSLLRISSLHSMRRSRAGRRLHCHTNHLGHVKTADVRAVWHSNHHYRSSNIPMDGSACWKSIPTRPRWPGSLLKDIG
eukprot:5128116-Amphidinium_carterae.3